MRQRTTYLAWLVAILGGAVLVAGCGSAGSSTTSTPLPSPSADRVLVFGTTANCGIRDLQTTDWTAGVETQTGTIICDYEMSDPRVTASEEAKLTMHWITVPGITEVDYFILEDDVLTNDGGTWRGSGWGSEYYDESHNLYTSGTSLYLGEGGYDGLSYRMLLARDTGPGQPYFVTGWIEPTD